MKTSSYTYSFKNGTYTITKGLRTKFDWYVTVKLNYGFIYLDQKNFLTRRDAKLVTENLLNKYNLL